MPATAVPTRPSALSLLATLGAAWVFVLVLLGAFTTSIGAGMVFSDWPLSNGSLNPQGWLGDLAMFAEHSHRLSAGLMSGITIGLAVAVWRYESRSWLRRLAGWAVALVLAQAVVGGLRVLLDHHQVQMVDTSVGRLFAMLHACLAQIFVCLLFAIAAGVSPGWIQAGTEAGPGPAVRRLGRLCCGLLLMQLAVAAVMRHSFAGLAIPTAPWSTPEGGLLPPAWNFRVGIQFAHRVLALVLAGALPALAVAVWRDAAAGVGLRTLALGTVGLLAVQIAFGIAVVRYQREAYVTTAHVGIGALTLAATFLLTLLLHRSRIEQSTSSSVQPAGAAATAHA